MSKKEHKVLTSLVRVTSRAQVMTKAGHLEPLTYKSFLLADSAPGKSKCPSFTPWKKPPVCHVIFCLPHGTWTHRDTPGASPEAQWLAMPPPCVARHLPHIAIYLCLNPSLKPVFSILSACTLNFYPVWQSNPLKKLLTLKNFKFTAVITLGLWIPLSLYLCTYVNTQMHMVEWM